MWNRRQFLFASGALSLFPRISFATHLASSNKKFVLVLLRGGLDGLAAIPPIGDGDYERARKNLALSRSELIDLDGFFGLHRALESLHPFWLKEELAIVHAVSSPYRNRSHFDAQKVLENGTDAPHGADDGWLNRALHALDAAPHAPVAIGRSVPLVLRGAQTVSALDPNRNRKQASSFVDEVRELYGDHPALAEALDQHLISQGLLDAAAVGRSMSSSATNRMMLGSERTGKLLATGEGPNIAVLELSGFDTHIRQGTDNGLLANRLRLLSEGLVALAESLGPAWENTVVAVVTEFGRTVAPNGSGGTDHGTASAAFLLGGAVKGGKVITDWPGLAPEVLYEGRDLQPTQDLRAVFSGLLNEHFSVPTSYLQTTVFRDGPSPLSGLIRT